MLLFIVDRRSRCSFVAGLDLVARKDLWEMLKTVKAGRAIIVTTHQMNEVDDIADRTLIMHQGHIAALGTSLYLKSMYEP